MRGPISYTSASLRRCLPLTAQCFVCRSKIPLAAAFSAGDDCPNAAAPRPHWQLMMMNNYYMIYSARLSITIEISHTS